jgi:hypothetical protein
MSYIGVEITSDPDEMTADSYEFLMQNVDGWEPSEGNLESWMIQALSRLVSLARDTASDVPPEIFRAWGLRAVGITPVDAVAATVTTTWTAVDNLGYTLPAGTIAAFQTSGDTLVAFVVMSNVTIPAGQTQATGVVMNAVDTGEESNGLGPGPLVLIDALAWVSSVAATTASGGGVEAETDDQYLDRLSDELRLLTPRPILATDYAVLARRVAGVHRAVGVDNYQPAKTVTATTVSGSATVVATGGTTFARADTGRSISGTGVPGGATMTYVDDTHATLSANASASGTGVSLTIAARSNAERAVTVVAIDKDGEPVGSGVRTNIVAYLDGFRETNFVVAADVPSYTVVNVVFAVTIFSGYDPVLVNAAIVDAVSDALSPATWGTDPDDESSVTWTNTTKVRYNEMIRIISTVSGVRYVNTLTLNGRAADVNLTGIAGLPRPGSVSGTVS